MKKILKVFSLITIFSILMMMMSVCFAGGTAITVGGLIKPDSTINGGEQLTEPIQKVVGAIRWAGYIIAVGLIVYIGIKYLMASAAEKADLKGLLVKYIVGAGLIVFGTQIAAWVFSING